MVASCWVYLDDLDWPTHRRLQLEMDGWGVALGLLLCFLFCGVPFHIGRMSTATNASLATENGTGVEVLLVQLDL